jgi:hypothetical protein
MPLLMSFTPLDLAAFWVEIDFLAMTFPSVENLFLYDIIFAI